MSGVILLVSLLMIINLYFPAHHCVTEDLSPPRSNHHLMSVASPGSHLTQLIVFKNWTQDTVWHTEGGEGNIFFFFNPRHTKGQQTERQWKVIEVKVIQLSTAGTRRYVTGSRAFKAVAAVWAAFCDRAAVSCDAARDSCDMSRSLSWRKLLSPSHRSLFSYLSVWGSETLSYKFASGH